MGINEDIGSRLRRIRGKRTQKRFVDELDLMKGMTRSYYSMVEIGKRPASLRLLDMISEQEHVSFDYLFGRVDSRIDIHDPRYHQLLEAWYLANDKEKDSILRHANQITLKGGKK